MKKTLDELKVDLALMDNMLTHLKQERVKEMHAKQNELDEQIEDNPDDEETIINHNIILEQYKEELNELLGINELRRSRENVKATIDEKERIEDSQTNSNYI